eukprot:NODE_3381_length_978_cov_35.716804_g3235_i0.p1 GENE.NODE_3381_length_978_cov_35.716804_g3235_i0~~NODE_3381_length_978_cov_35.716804_g3235_i0.p1  ORF type:complete len:284 (+),score=56.28 NODE_3381_length_978_cov_35.716804_g3235_i0:52-903(+)
MYLPSGLPWTHSRLIANLTVLLLASAGVYLLFFWSYCVLLPRHVRFAALDAPTRGELASRLHSTVHAVLVFILAIWSCNQCNLWSDPLSNDCKAAEVLYSIVVGYFLSDLTLLLYFRFESWKAFCVHHLVALSPYLINNFLPHSSQSNYLLCLMICVEVSTIFLNTQCYMEQIGWTDSRAHTVCVYAVYISWTFFRVLLPGYAMFLMIQIVMPVYGFRCRFLVGYVACTIITLFCWGCWVFFFTPKIVRRWKAADVIEAQDEEAQALLVNDLENTLTSSLSHI